MSEAKKKRIALALTGASGAPYFIRMLQRLRPFADLELHLMASEGGKRVLREETGTLWKNVPRLGLQVHRNRDIGASLASGSFRLHAMVILPCSMNTAAAIAAGMAQNLIHRCAAVQLKEDRQLILVPRETPLSLIQLRNLVRLRESGAVIMPAAPGFYHGAEDVTGLLDTVIDRIFDHLGIEDDRIRRWKS